MLKLKPHSNTIRSKNAYHHMFNEMLQGHPMAIKLAANLFKKLLTTVHQPNRVEVLSRSGDNITLKLFVSFMDLSKNEARKAYHLL